MTTDTVFALFSTTKAVTATATGEEGMDRLRAFRPDIVVLDYALPVMNGIEATRSILSLKPDVKVLSDGWTAVTRDRSLSAQFEHSIGVTQDRRFNISFTLAGIGTFSNLFGAFGGQDR